MYAVYVNDINIQSFRIHICSQESAVQTAADELTAYLKLQNLTDTGTIHIGLLRDMPEIAQKNIQTEKESIYIGVNGRNVYIAGGCGRAVIYAVYEFLERYCGWGFYTPEIETEPIGTVNLGNLDYTYTPPWDYRMVLAPRGSFAGSHFRKRRLNANWGTVSAPDEFGGTVTFATQQNCHTFRDLIPEEVYFEEHPEYFAMNEQGERVRDKVCGTQPCLSHPKVFEIVLENLKKDLKAHPNARFASVSQNDGHVFCHCDACRKVNEEEQTDGGTIYRFVNRIAEAIKEEFPNVMIDTLPYNYSTKPPAKTVMRDNVSICLCLMVACREHAIADESCPYNEKVRKYLADWSKICKYLRIWDYNANFNNYPICLPNIKLLYQNVKYLRKFAVKGIMFQGAHTTMPDIEFSALWSYLESRLAWSPDMSYVEYLNCVKEFLNAYYGSAAPFMYDYLMLLMMQPSSNYHYGPAATCEQVIPMLHWPDGTPNMTFIQDGNELLDLAEIAANGKALEHVKRTRLHLTWYELCTTYQYIREHGTPDEIEKLRNKYELFMNAVSGWEYFRISEGRRFFGTEFDFDVNPNSFIRSLF